MKNIAEVKYKELERNRIKIIAFVNFLTSDELVNRYGRATALYYCVRSIPSMYKVVESGSENITITTMIAPNLLRSIHLSYQVNDIMSKETFTQMISLMKDCGRNLIDAIKEVKKEEEETIKTIRI